MLLGRQDRADHLIASALATLPDRLLADPRPDFRIALYEGFYRSLRERSWSGTPLAGRSNERQEIADGRLQSLPLLHRTVLLLLAAERFAPAAIAQITGLSEREILAISAEAHAAIERDLETTVLIIEDEWAIARDLRRIVGSLGHRVTAVAADRDEAIGLAAEHRPGLVLADVNLGDGGSGVDAVRAIVAEKSTPAVFVTAFPERLLVESTPEPTYFITKPFSSVMIKSTVSQALFFS
jgi:CheY-like chemotaxis protein